MKYVNRCVLTLKPRQAFMQWVSALDTEQPEDWSFEGGSYLLDEQASETAIVKDIQEHAATILENEFSVWTEETSVWPKERDYNQLCNLFDLCISVVGFDIGKEPLLRADMTMDGAIFT